MKVAIFSSFRKLVRRPRLRLPWSKTHDTSQGKERATRIGKAQKYYYIRYAIGALRVVAWIALVLGVIASLVWGINMGGIEGGVRIILGIIGSFLTWLSLLAAREVLRLFIDVKENTRTTAERIGE
jgi:hypothetical protein